MDRRPLKTPAAQGVAGILLAAGLSRRYGAADKLSAPLAGLPLGLHAARAMAALGLDTLIAVVGAAPLDYASEGFSLCRNPAPETGQAGSVSRGVAAARALGATAVLIALADMPAVGVAHLRAVVAAGLGHGTRVGSVVDGRIMPPALFGADWFAALEALNGDRGARTLLDGAVLVSASAADMIDIDTPADYGRLAEGNMI